MEALDPQQFIPLGIMGVVAALLFRSWWRTEDGWKTMFDTARQDAADARADAAIARQDASAARATEAECRRRLDANEAQIHLLERRIRELENHTPPGGYLNT